MTIEKLIIKIQEWRKNKKSLSEKIPIFFWKEAIKLAKESGKPASVASKLGLNCRDLKRKMGLSVKNKKEINFKELMLQKSVASNPILELTTSMGMTIKVYQ